MRSEVPSDLNSTAPEFTVGSTVTGGAACKFSRCQEHSLLSPPIRRGWFGSRCCAAAKSSLASNDRYQFAAVHWGELTVPLCVEGFIWSSSSLIMPGSVRTSRGGNAAFGVLVVRFRYGTWTCNPHAQTSLANIATAGFQLSIRSRC